MQSSAPTYANGSANSVCSILTSDAKRRGMAAAVLIPAPAAAKPPPPLSGAAPSSLRRSIPAPAAAKPPPPLSGAAPSSLRRSRLPVRRRFSGQELQGVLERRPKNGEAVSTSTGRAGEIDDESVADHAGRAARQQRVRCLRDRVGTDRLCDPGHFALDRSQSRLGRDVPRRDARAACREHEPRLRCEIADRAPDLLLLVRHDAALDLEPVGGEQFFERVAARVLALAGDDAVRDRQHGGFHSRSSGGKAAASALWSGSVKPTPLKTSPFPATSRPRRSSPCRRPSPCHRP